MSLKPAPSLSYTTLTILAAMFIFGPLTTMVDAYVAGKMWSMYLTGYGSGPAFWQWYGIMLLLELPLIGVLIKLDDLVETDGRDVASRLVKISTMKVVIALLSLVSAWFVHRLAT